MFKFYNKTVFILCVLAVFTADEPLVQLRLRTLFNKTGHTGSFLAPRIKNAAKDIKWASQILVNRMGLLFYGPERRSAQAVVNVLLTEFRKQLGGMFIYKPGKVSAEELDKLYRTIQFCRDDPGEFDRTMKRLECFKTQAPDLFAAMFSIADDAYHKGSSTPIGRAASLIQLMWGFPDELFEPVLAALKTLNKDEYSAAKAVLGSLPSLKAVPCPALFIRSVKVRYDVGQDSGAVVRYIQRMLLGGGYRAGDGCDTPMRLAESIAEGYRRLDIMAPAQRECFERLCVAMMYLCLPDGRHAFAAELASALGTEQYRKCFSPDLLAGLGYIKPWMVQEYYGNTYNTETVLWRNIITKAIKDGDRVTASIGWGSSVLQSDRIDTVTEGLKAQGLIQPNPQPQDLEPECLNQLPQQFFEDVGMKLENGRLIKPGDALSARLYSDYYVVSRTQTAARCSNDELYALIWRTYRDVKPWDSAHASYFSRLWTRKRFETALCASRKIVEQISRVMNIATTSKETERWARILLAINAHTDFYTPTDQYIHRRVLLLKAWSLILGSVEWAEAEPGSSMPRLRIRPQVRGRLCSAGFQGDVFTRLYASHPEELKKLMESVEADDGYAFVERMNIIDEWHARGKIALIAAAVSDERMLPFIGKALQIMREPNAPSYGALGAALLNAQILLEQGYAVSDPYYAEMVMGHFFDQPEFDENRTVLSVGVEVMADIEDIDFDRLAYCMPLLTMCDVKVTAQFNNVVQFSFPPGFSPSTCAAQIKALSHLGIVRSDFVKCHVSISGSMYLDMMFAPILHAACSSGGVGGVKPTAALASKGLVAERDYHVMSAGPGFAQPKKCVEFRTALIPVADTAEWTTEESVRVFFDGCRMMRRGLLSFHDVHMRFLSLLRQNGLENIAALFCEPSVRSARKGVGKNLSDPVHAAMDIVHMRAHRPGSAFAANAREFVRQLFAQIDAEKVGNSLQSSA